MKRIVYIFCLAFLIFGCSKSSTNEGDGGENPYGIGNGGEV